MSTLPVPVQPEPKKPVNSTVIILAIAAGVLVLVVVALVFLSLGRGLGAGDNATIIGSPTSTATPSATPSPTQDAVEPQPEPEAEDTTPRFTSFDAQTQVQCPSDGEKPEITFSWSTAYATEVWYTSGHEDAKDDNYMQVPLSGSQNDLTDEHLFPCAHRQSEDYTVTLVGADGSHVSEYFTVTDLNWQGGDDSDD